MNDDLKIIKKKYGEQMMHLCRELFSTIIDNSPGVLPMILLERFAPSHLLYSDIANEHEEDEGTYIEQFQMYIYSIYNHLNKNVEPVKNRVLDPVTLMKQAGYTLYECQTESDIQNFKKYYAPGEELCTFNGGRLNRCYVYFAVKDHALELHRQDFKAPQRQDEYGTSVISIQFTRDSSHTLSIKNRYNHTVSNPDATYSNDLDNIISGLTQSFANYYGMDQRNYDDGIDVFEMLGYVEANDGKLYKYNYELDNMNYCPNNIVIDNYKVTQYDKEKYLVMDYFILDLVNKKFINRLIEPYQDSFPDTIPNIKKIEIINNNPHKKVIITPEDGEDIIVTLDKFNQIIGYRNNNITQIPNYFLKYNETLVDITIDNVTVVGCDFLKNNKTMRHLSLPGVLVVDSSFLQNSHLITISLPNVTTIGNYFMQCSYELESLELPKVKVIGKYFLSNNNLVKTLSLPKAIVIGDDFLLNNKILETIFLPKVISIGELFCFWNESLTMVKFPQVKRIGDRCLSRNSNLKRAILPKLELLGCFFAENSNLELFYAPSLVLIDTSEKITSLAFDQKINHKIRKLIK